MPVEIVMPKLGLTMASGTIARWIKAPGEAVREGEPLVEVSTDKITYEVESPASGTVARSCGKDGEEFACGDVIGHIALAGESDIAPASRRAGESDIAPASRRAGESDSAFVDGGAAPATTVTANGGRIVSSPAARRLARELGVALAEISGTGPRGRITLADVHDVRRSGASTVPDRFGSSAAPVAASVTLPPRLPAARRVIYRKMTEVGRLPLAQVETVARVDAVHALMQRRGDFGWTAFAVHAVARLLREHGDLRTDAATGAPFEHIDIGVAADTPHGLIVPVVRDAERRSLAEIQREIVRLAALARDGTIGAHDIGGACFSISNVGPQGVERVAPLPDPPQTAILGIGVATLRPTVATSATLHPTIATSATLHPTVATSATLHPTVATSATLHPTVATSATLHPTVATSATERSSAEASATNSAPLIVAAWMLTCVVSFDHRFIDGAPAARFLAAFARACADPGVLL
jgi:pyruvate/2-oxoglutarate dehydrogenase complex dihydrolipoamide acyltransferase (E2) component